MKADNTMILQGTKKDYTIKCKHCDWSITYLNTTYWKVERTMEMISAMPSSKGGCEHSLQINELN